MTKFCSNDSINRSLDRAQKRREIVNKWVDSKLEETEARFGDGNHAYMTGYLASLLASCAQAESIAELRRTLAYSGIDVKV